MLLLAAIAAASAAPAERPGLEARAAVRIERPMRVTGEAWNSLPEARRREILVRDEQGRLILLRLVENE